MGLIGRILEFTRTQRGLNLISVIKGKPGARPKTSDYYSAPNEDAVPLPGDYYVLVPIPGSGQYVAVAYNDLLEKVAQAGEKRIYARNAGGAEVCQIWLKNNGTIRIGKLPGPLGYVEIKEDGTVEINGATITPEGDVVSATGISLNFHTHAVITGAGAPGTTGPAIPGGP